MRILVQFILLLGVCPFSQSLESLGEKLKDPGQGNGFGEALALSGDIAVVGQITGTAAKAWVYRVSDSSGNILKTLSATPECKDCCACHFGTSVAIDGDYILVGAQAETVGGIHSVGAAYLFRIHNLTDAGIQQIDRFGSPDPVMYGYFGQTVAINAENDIAIVAEPGGKTPGDDQTRGVLYIFGLSNGTLIRMIFNETSGFPWNIGTGASSTKTGNFGKSLSTSGNLILIGSKHGYNKGPGTAYLYDIYGTYMMTFTTDEDPYQAFNFGKSLALDPIGMTAIIGQHEATIGAKGLSGAVYVYDLNNGTCYKRKISLGDTAAGSFDYFGDSVSVSGNLLLIGATGVDRHLPGGTSSDQSGVAYVYDMKDGHMLNTVTEYDDIPDRYLDNLGRGLAINEDYILVGAHLQQTGSGSPRPKGVVYRYATPTPCTGNTCGPGQLCTVKGDSYSCACPIQFTGDQCQYEIPKARLMTKEAGKGVSTPYETIGGIQHLVKCALICFSGGSRCNATSYNEALKECKLSNSTHPVPDPSAVKFT